MVGGVEREQGRYTDFRSPLRESPAMKIRTLLLVPAALSLSLFASVGQAYELSRADYQALGEELPAWDHDGNLPQGAGQLYELQQIHQQIEERAQRLQISAFILKMMEKQAPDTVKYASLRADYATQQQSYARWRESAERRRQAILLDAGLGASANVSDHSGDGYLSKVSSNP